MWSQRMVGPRTFAMDEVPAPTAADLQPGEVLLRVLAGGICGSDLPEFKGVKGTPGISPGGPWGAPRHGHPMHEVVGEVLASRHPDLEPGVRVVGWASKFDAVQEVIISRGDDLAPYNPALAPTTAVLIQPLACVMFALDAMTGIAGANAAVIGQGPIGSLFSHVLKFRGAERVTGIDLVDRSGSAAHFGVDDAVHASAAQWSASLTEEAQRPGIVVEAVGHHVTTLDNALNAAAFGAQIYYFGIPDDEVYPMNMLTFLRKNLTLRSGVTIDRVRMLREADAYLSAHPELAETYVTDVVPADQVQSAFERAVSPSPKQLKIALSMA
jgi:L-iditol 2-dehydrogenase